MKLRERGRIRSMSSPAPKLYHEWYDADIVEVLMVVRGENARTVLWLHAI
jgi:hypothetical protein